MALDSKSPRDRSSGTKRYLIEAVSTEYLTVLYYARRTLLSGVPA